MKCETAEENEENLSSYCRLILWFVKFVNECKARNYIEITERIFFSGFNVRTEMKFSYNCIINSFNENAHLAVKRKMFLV